MALGVDPSRKRHPHQLHGRRLLAAVRLTPEHHRADLHRSDAPLDVQRQGERPSWIFIPGDMREQLAGVDVHRMATRGLDEGDSRPFHAFAQVFDGANAVAQIILIQRFLQPDGDGLQIIPCQAPVGGESFAQDLHIFAALGQIIIIHGQKAADVGHAILFGAHGGAVGVAEHLLCDLHRRFVGVALLPHLDEPGVFRKAAGVDEEGNVMTMRNLTGPSDIGHAHGLASSGVIGDGDHHHGDFPWILGQRAFQLLEIHVPLEGMDGLRLMGLGDGDVQGDSLAIFDVGAGGVEMGVVGDDVARFQRRTEQNPLRRPPLMRGQHMLEAGDFLDHSFEFVE